MKPAIITATAIAIAIAVALINIIPHPQAHADTSSDDPRASQALRRYALQLLHILSNADANQWQRYRQAIEHCASAPKRLDEIAAGSDASPLDRALIALTDDLCADLDLQLDEARTVGLLVNEPDAIRGYVLIPGNFNNHVHLIDHLGRVVHSWQLRDRVVHARLLNNGNLLAEVGADHRNTGGAVVENAIVEADAAGNIVWEYTHRDDIHHDFLNMPNGNVLILLKDFKTSEEAIALGVSPDIVPSGGMSYDYLIEVRPNENEGGQIVWEWSPLDYIVQDSHTTGPNYADPSKHPELIDANFSVGKLWANREVLDLVYINGIDYNPALDQIAISARYYSELWIIDHSATTEDAPTLKGGNAGKGGALLYRWGNPRAYRHGTAADRWLFGQHHTHWIAPGLPGAGNILVFNNGNDIDGDPPYYSSIEEIVPLLDGYDYRREPGAAYPPAEPVWRYTSETPSDFYASILSGVQRLPNGNTLICHGTQGNLFQVTPDGKTVWQYVYPMDGNTPLKQGETPPTVWNPYLGIFNNAVYRAYWYASDHPGLLKYDLTPGNTIERYD